MCSLYVVRLLVWVRRQIVAVGMLVRTWPHPQRFNADFIVIPLLHYGPTHKEANSDQESSEDLYGISGRGNCFDSEWTALVVRAFGSL